MSSSDLPKGNKLPKYLEIKEAVAQAARQNGRDPQEIILLAVSKGCSLEEILSTHKEGCRDFGESRVQEALLKIPAAPQGIRWHLIGSLQKNKVNKAIGKFALIHSVDSLELAEKISNASLEGPKTAILLQVNTSGEPSKHGLSGEEWLKGLERVLQLPGISVEGLMTIAPFVEDEKIIRECFASLRKWQGIFSRYCPMRHLSMGMSHDWRIAVEEGATILRIGTTIFGEKDA